MPDQDSSSATTTDTLAWPMLKGLWMPGLRAALLLTFLTGLIYPLVTMMTAQVLFPHQANGSLISNSQGPLGSKLIGQQFSSPNYIHPRPSATLPMPYNPKASSGSNLGPTNSVLIASVRQRAIDYRLANGLASDVALPVDAVTASASGLDPHISLANARLQVARVAHARGFQATQVQQLLQSHVEPRLLGLFGEPRINVLRLNLALDVLSQKTSMESHHVR